VAYYKRELGAGRRRSSVGERSDINATINGEKEKERRNEKIRLR
jgi:hypothetical protein